MLLALGILGSTIYAMLPDPVPVEFAHVRRGLLEATVNEDGRTRVRDRYEILAPVAGSLSRVEAEPGDSVLRGEVVARLVPLAPPLLDERTRAEAESRVAAAAAVLRQARTTVTRASDAAVLARRDAERLRALHAAGATSLQAVEQADLVATARAEEQAAARATVQAAEAELAGRQATLAGLSGASGGRSGQATVPLRAPIDGVVLSVRRESEGPIPAGQPVLVIGNPRALEVEVDLLTADAALVRPGAPVRIEHWGGTAPLRGRVLRVEPAAFTKLSALGVEEQRVNVIVGLEDPVEDRAGLGDGFRVEARLLVWSLPQAVQVPVSAIFRRGEGWAVFREEGGRARLAPIVIGRRTDAAAEVRRGLRPGDRVVAYPGEQVREGVRLRAR